jgi:hypothetical protein
VVPEGIIVHGAHYLDKVACDDQCLHIFFAPDFSDIIIFGYSTKTDCLLEKLPYGSMPYSGLMALKRGLILQSMNINISGVIGNTYILYYSYELLMDLVH